MDKSSVQSLCLRCDASSEIGVGHVMRCLALAQEWKRRGGRATFCCHSLPDPVADRLLAEGFQVVPSAAPPGSSEDARRVARLAEAGSALVLDGYCFDDRYEAIASVGWSCVLAFDDFGHADHRHCDLVLNQNLSARSKAYDRTQAQLLLGLDYCQLRSEFLESVADAPLRETGRHVLITFGGSDPPNATGQIVSALEPLLDSMPLKLRLVLGPGYRHDSPGPKLARHHEAVQIDRDVSEMVPVYQWADLVICGGGSSNWELSCLGIPRLVIPIVENQRPIARELAMLEACEVLEDPTGEQIGRVVRRLLLSPERRKQMMIASRRMVDGRGSQRVVDELLNQLNHQNRSEDCGT